MRQLVRGLAGKNRIRVCAALRPGTVSDPATATKVALRSLARRWLAHSEAAFVRLCGVAPIPASSGRTDRHRLHGGGDRDANRALWRITLVRMHCHRATKDYVTRRTAEGKSEIMRCLKRYIAREAFTHLAPRPTEQAPWPGATTDGR